MKAVLSKSWHLRWVRLRTGFKWHGNLRQDESRGTSLSLQAQTPFLILSTGVGGGLVRPGLVVQNLLGHLDLPLLLEAPLALRLQVGRRRGQLTLPNIRGDSKS